MSKSYPSYPAGIDWLKSTVNTIVLYVLGRAFQTASKLDNEVQEEIKAWPEGFTVMMRILPAGPKMVVQKKGDRVKYLLGAKQEDADLVINFKNDTAAFLIFTAQVGTAKGYAEHRMSVKGDLTDAMVLIRCLTIVQSYLFPKIISSMILKRVPQMPLRRQLNRLYIYTLGMLGL